MTSLATKAMKLPPVGARVRLAPAFADWLAAKKRERDASIMGTVKSHVVARKDNGQKLQVEWDRKHSTEALWPYNLEMLT